MRLLNIHNNMFNVYILCTMYIIHNIERNWIVECRRRVDSMRATNKLKIFAKYDNIIYFILDIICYSIIRMQLGIKLEGYEQ